MQTKASIVVIGGGQAGLSVSHQLTQLGLEHQVLERGRIGQTWRYRWDSFCLVTPNWTVKLPGGEYQGDDPHGFMPRDDIVRHLESYATDFPAPVREGITVTGLRRKADGGFLLSTSEGELHAGSVVVATGAYQRPHRPAGVTVPSSIPQLDAESYRNEAALPPGWLLIVGSGQTGCQLAEELREAGRDVVLACGKAPWFMRRLDGRDVFHWAVESGQMDQTIADLPSPAARLGGNVQATGHGGGHDLHYRTLQRIGVTLTGHFLGIEGGRAHFAPDLADSVAFGDARYRDVRESITKACVRLGVGVPEMPDPAPFAAEAPESRELAGLGAVIFTSGFRPDYRSWIHLDAFDELGFPIQVDGASTVVPGLFFCGVHFLRKRKSSLLLGVGEDATIVAGRMAEHQASPVS